MQYIRYENCGSPEGVRQEIARLAEENYLSQQQAAMVDCEQVAAFFRQDIGRRLCSGAKCLREFKFSLLVDAEEYFPEAVGEEVLLQGVVDLWFEDSDGVTVVDFKSDQLLPGAEAERAEFYRPQLEAYSKALQTILGVEKIKTVLWFFKTATAVEL